MPVRPLSGLLQWLCPVRGCPENNSDRPGSRGAVISLFPQVLCDFGNNRTCFLSREKYITTSAKPYFKVAESVRGIPYIDVQYSEIKIPSANLTIPIFVNLPRGM